MDWILKGGQRFSQQRGGIKRIPDSSGRWCVWIMMMLEAEGRLGRRGDADEAGDQVEPLLWRVPQCAVGQDFTLWEPKNFVMGQYFRNTSPATGYRTGKNKLWNLIHLFSISSLQISLHFPSELQKLSLSLISGK